MGETHSQPTKGKHTPQPRAFNRINYEIVCAEVIQHTTLHRDRKITELQKAEAVVRQKLSEVPVVGMDVIHEANACLSVLNQVRGANIALRNMSVLKEQSMAIENMVKTNTPLGELTSIVYTVVWSTKRLNLSVIGKFDQLIKYYFDPKIYQNVETSTLVDLEMKSLFASLLPTPRQTNDYLKSLCQRSNIDVAVLGTLWPSDTNWDNVKPQVVQPPPPAFHPSQNSWGQSEPMQQPNQSDPWGQSEPMQQPNQSDPWGQSQPQGNPWEVSQPQGPGPVPMNYGAPMDNAPPISFIPGKSGKYPVKNPAIQFSNCFNDVPVGYDMSQGRFSVLKMIGA